jgi:hypothetical protein
LFSFINYDYTLKCSLVGNGLAKFRGRLKELSNQTAKEASPVNLFIFFSKPNLGGLLVFLN